MSQQASVISDPRSTGGQIYKTFVMSNKAHAWYGIFIFETVVAF